MSALIEHLKSDQVFDFINSMDSDYKDDLLKSIQKEDNYITVTGEVGKDEVTIIVRLKDDIRGIRGTSVALISEVARLTDAGIFTEEQNQQLIGFLENNP